MLKVNLLSAGLDDLQRALLTKIFLRFHDSMTGNSGKVYQFNTGTEH